MLRIAAGCRGFQPSHNLQVHGLMFSAYFPGYREVNSRHHMFDRFEQDVDQ